MAAMCLLLELVVNRLDMGNVNLSLVGRAGDDHAQANNANCFRTIHLMSSNGLLFP